MTDVILILLLLAAIGAVILLCRVATTVECALDQLQLIKLRLEHIRVWGFEICKALHRPPSPPTPYLMKERVCFDMERKMIYFPFLLPEVPSTGAPVKRIVSVAFNGVVKKRFENVTLRACRLHTWAEEGTSVTVTTYTVDAAGNLSEASTVTEMVLDVFPPPAPPKAELLIELLAEVEESEVGEISIHEVDPTPPVEPEAEAETEPLPEPVPVDEPNET